jgi:hypothetical protein
MIPSPDVINASLTNPLQKVILSLLTHPVEVIQRVPKTLILLVVLEHLPLLSPAATGITPPMKGASPDYQPQD